MNTVLTFIAWTIDLFLHVLSAATAGCFFLVSPAFRRQSYERFRPLLRRHDQSVLKLPSFEFVERFDLRVAEDDRQAP
jgi:hypothetical protein